MAGRVKKRLTRLNVGGVIVKRIFTIFALICWFQGTQKPILEIQVTSKIKGGVFNTPIRISNIDFLYTDIFEKVWCLIYNHVKIYFLKFIIFGYF